MMLIEVIILLLAIPAGFLLAYLARDELVQGRKWFKTIIILSVFSGLWFYLTREEAIAWGSAFIVITTFISYFKSFDKSWTKKKD